MTKTRDTFYQYSVGFKPLHRETPKNGQSEWYYNYSHNEKNEEIDVENENELNPYMDNILINDMKENPDNYYIWRTSGDDKVRTSHKKREGKIFNIHIPPEGGKPGEAYNCRCHAEPYIPNKSSTTKIVDLSGLEQNAKGKENYTIKKLSNEMYKNIISFLHNSHIEGYKNFPYLDSEGNDTICTGHLITPKEQLQLPYYILNTNESATNEEIIKEYNELHKYINYQKNSSLNDSLNADYFKNITKLRLTQKQCDLIDRKIIETKWTELVDKFPNFTIMNPSLQQAIFDVHYQTNILKKVKEQDIIKNHPYGQYAWKNLWLNASNKNIQGIVNNLQVNDGNEYRNKEKINLALQGKFLK